MSHIKMAVNSLLFGTFLFFSFFTIKCYIYGILLSQIFKGFFTNLKKKKKKLLTQFAGNKTSSNAYFWVDGWMEINAPKLVIKTSEEGK